MKKERILNLLDLDHSPLKNPDRWIAVDKKLGVNLPKGYKVLVERFGPKCFAGEIQLLSPFTKKVGLRLVDDGRNLLENLEQSNEGLEGFSVFPYRVEPGGLLPWAISSGGAVLFFIMMGDPDLWPTMIQMSRGQDFEVKFHRSPAILIHQYCSGVLPTTLLTPPKL